MDDKESCVELWNDVPAELLNVIAQKLKYVDEITRFSAACKSCNSAASEVNHQLTLSWKYPWLLLAEDTGLDLSACKVGADDTPEVLDPVTESIPSSRGLFSLETRKIYYLDLPEATNKLILGTNKGWLFTLGRDLEINLLHPLRRLQIRLPPMLTLPCQEEYHEDYSAQEASTKYITKVALSSQVPTKSDFRGEVYMCDIDDNDDTKERQPPKGKLITSIPISKHDRVRSYMVEALSGSHIWVVLRFHIKATVEEHIPDELRYYTSNFLVLKLDVHQSDSNEIPSCTWVKDVKDLGNEALFIGRTSSTSVASSDFIKPNSIYFTDDLWEGFWGTGGGHDMGIFNVQTGEIQPHFSGMSIHKFSPPMWYI